MTYAVVIIATQETSTLVRIREAVVLEELRALVAMLAPGVSVQLVDDGRMLATFRA